MNGHDVVRILVDLAWLFAAVVALRSRRSIGSVALAGAAAGAIAIVADLASRGSIVTGIALGLAGAAALNLLLVLPDGTLRAPRLRWLLAAVYAVAAAAGALAFSDSASVRWLPLVALALAATPVGLWYSNQRYHRANALDQRAMQWLGLSIVVAVELGVVVIGLRVIADWPHDLSTAFLVAVGIVGLGLAATASRRLLTRVDRALAYAVSFTGLSSMVLLVYVVVAISHGHSLSHDERDLLLVSMVGAGVAALAYPIARGRLEIAANRLVYGERVAPDDATRKFGARMTRAVPMDELLLQLCESLRKSLRLRSAEVWTGTDGRLEVAAGIPHRDRAPLTLNDKSLPVVARAGVSGGTWIDIWMPALVEGRGASTDVRVAPLAHAGELLGLIVCERHPGGEPFTEDGDLTLTELSRQVAVALHNVNLDSALQQSLVDLQERNVELQQSRARIVAAGDAERRKLERNLHDGAQQHLVALAVKVRLARDSVEDDPADAIALLDELRSDLQEAIAELRALAHGIFPPLLMSGGLAQALPAAAARSPQPATVACEHTERHTPEIEAAVYFCCLEAMQNANKHAGDDATLALRLWRNDSDELCFEVADDGHGFEADGATINGHGFVNMADRLGAMHGVLEIESKPGHGTTIRGRIPLPESD